MKESMPCLESISSFLAILVTLNRALCPWCNKFHAKAIKISKFQEYLDIMNIEISDFIIIIFLFQTKGILLYHIQKTAIVLDDQ